MMVQNTDSGENDMSGIVFPSDFPTLDTMMSVLKKTFEKSWKVDLDIEDVNTWLSNFKGAFFDTEDERRLALWLLCNFTYYNDDEINHLCSILFKNFIHVLMVDRSLSTSKEVEACINQIVFTSIGRASESGGLLLYHFRQEANLSTDRFVFPTTIKTTKSDIIVCVDDVIMSGGTSARFFYDNEQEFKDKHIYYLTLLTSQDAIDRLSMLNITVIPCAKLDNRNKIFSKDSLCFFKYPMLREPAKTIAEGYGKIIEPKKPLGHNDGQYCFGFSYNIPNNSLPIFWSSNNWSPIFYRKEKYQNAKQIKREYSFFI